MNRRRWTLGVVMVACAAVFPACAALDDGNDPSTETAHATSGLAAAEPDALDADFLETPAGRIHRSCIHDIGDGAKVDDTGQVTLSDGRTIRFAPCKYQIRDARTSRVAPPPLGGASIGGPVTQAWLSNGWFEYDSATTGTNVWGYNWINKLDGKWRVPPAPRQYTNQIVYLFTGLSPLSGASILQPVLQYGVSPAGGGNFWAMAVWFVNTGAGIALHGNLQRVNVGDTIEGYMTGNNCSAGGGCTWNLQAWDGLTWSSTMSVATSDVFRWAFKGVLEAYRISNCNKLPVELDTGTTFFDVHVYQPGPNTFNFNEVTTSLGWGGTVLGEGCSYGVIDTPFGAELYWQ